ncbi:MAG: hypothetical protein JJU29_13070 [Verrucomicrobia bacterium]|nr:hypothetical protein [Verrucomicrobiota bacterium]
MATDKSAQMHGLTPFASLFVGILTEPFHHHWPYIAACRELGVSYRLVNIMGDDWREALRESACDAFLVWPAMGYRPFRKLFDIRLREMEESLGLTVYPRYAETRLYEDKVRTAAWLRENDIPHPATRVFEREEDARTYAESAPLPLLVKTRLGAMASGVWIVRERSQLVRLIRKAFGKGLLADYRHRSEREKGFILLQEYLPVVSEWRLVRIGDSYFGHKKGKSGDFHSGSGLVDWTPPETRHLDFLHQVTETGKFRSMAVDTFETPDGKLWVNELQTVFSAKASVHQTKVDGKPGRFVRGVDGSWTFEPGDFARNACCNLRIQDVVCRFAAEKQGLQG